MRKTFALVATAAIFASWSAQAQAPQSKPVPVTVESFARAESDLYFAGIVRNGGFGKFDHTREPAPLDKQTVIRLNRDTLYSSAVFDLDAGPVTITIPDAGQRFISMQVFDEDQYTHRVAYKPGPYTLTRESVGTRYVAVAFRTLANPSDRDDMKHAHSVQDAIKVEQPGGPGKFKIPAWDQASQKTVRDLLIALSDTLPDKNRMFGTRAEVDPVRFLLGAASGWGGNPDKEAVYLNVVPEKNDGRTVYGLKVPASVPVDAFWSVSLYNKDGFFEKNELGAYLPVDWRPLRVELDINRPCQTALFEDLFQCPVIFNAPAVTIVVERHHLSAAPRCASWPVVTMEDVARDRPGGAPRGLLDVVMEQIRAQVLTGSVSIDRVARPLGTSVGTLQRELDRVGTDFRSLTNAARLQRTTELLRHTDGSITRVSAEMGYSSPANFARAFQKATGRTPREFRSNI